MSLDQFYTKTAVAVKYYEILLRLIDLKEYDYILEPSAGTGSFFKLFPLNNNLTILRY